MTSYVYFVDPVTAKLISANFDFPPFQSNPPNLIPANISGYTVFLPVVIVSMNQNAILMFFPTDSAGNCALGEG